MLKPKSTPSLARIVCLTPRSELPKPSIRRPKANQKCSQASLPYIDAIIQETLRWQLISPLAVPHVVNADDEYEGNCTLICPPSKTANDSIRRRVFNPKGFFLLRKFMVSRYNASSDFPCLKHDGSSKGYFPRRRNVPGSRRIQTRTLPCS